jgi:Ca-activated chloride channel homolog
VRAVIAAAALAIMVTGSPRAQLTTVAPGAHVTPVATQQRFRTGVDAVRVDVLVTDGNRPVGGLTADDFELRDKGVRQRIEAVDLGDVPLSVMLALDTSVSVWGESLQHLKEAASAVVALLTPDDRAAVLTFSGALQLKTSWTSSRAQLEAAVSAAQATGATSLHDAAYAALTLRDDRPGRALVLIFSDGDDTASWLSGQSVVGIARRNDAVVYSVGLRQPNVHRPGYRVDFLSGVQPPIPNAPGPVLMESFLSGLAEETGGKYIDARQSARLREAFIAILTEFRSRYLVTYTPVGVDAGGWHPIDVRLKSKKGRVTARRGYMR